MEPKWYYAQQSEKVGPVSWEELQALSRSGIILPTTMVLREGSARWIEARSVLTSTIGTESVNVSSGSAGAAKSSNKAAATPSNESRLSKKQETWIGACVVASIIILVLVRAQNWLFPSASNKTPDASSANPRNPTVHYWAQVNDILGTLGRHPREDAVWVLRQTASAIQRLPTLGVDLDVVGWSLRVAQVCEQFAELVETSRNPTILVEFFLRASNKDFAGVPLDLLAAERVAWNNADRVRQEGLRLRATLTARYRLEFPASRF